MRGVGDFLAGRQAVLRQKQLAVREIDRTGVTAADRAMTAAQNADDPLTLAGAAWALGMVQRVGRGHVVGVWVGGVGIGGEVIAELAVVHHRGEDAGLVPGQPVQPVGELLAVEAAQSRLARVVTTVRVFIGAVGGMRGPTVV